LGESLDDSQVQIIHEQSEGNSLFVTEMVRAGIHLTPSGQNSLPERVKSIIDWRFKQLSGSALKIIELAAVIGRSVSYDLLKEAIDIDEGTLVDGLDECWRSRILRERGSQGYDFSHAKIRQAAYVGLSQARRRFLHGRVAEVLEQLAVLQPEALNAAVAYHYAAAGQFEKAAVHYEKAAHHARNLYALTEAITHLESALQILPDLPRNKPLAGRLYEQFGEALLMSGRYEAALRALSNAMHRLEPGNFIDQARLSRRVAETWSSQQRYDEAEEALRNALDNLGDQPPADKQSEWMQEWLEIRFHQVDIFYFRNQPDEMQSTCDLLEGPLDKYGSLEQRAEYFTLRAMLNNNLSRYRVSPQTISLVKKALELAEQVGDPFFLARKHFGLGFNLLLYGERLRAITQLDQALALADKIGATYLQNQALAYLAIAYRMNGDLEAVGQLARRGLALAEAGRHPNYQGVALANLAWLAYHKDDLEEAENLAESALKLWRQTGYPLGWLADFPLAAAAIKQGDLRRAQKSLAAVLHLKQQRLPDDLEAQLEMASSTHHGSDSPSSREAVRQALDIAGRLGYL
jgi:predicted ATPase